MSILKGALNATATYGKIEMNFSVIVSAILAIISLIVLIWLITSFEANYVTTKATITTDPVCTTTKNVTTGTTDVKFRYNNKDYSLKVDIGQGCYNYTKNSTVNVKFDPNNINQTIIVALQDYKTTYITIASICLVIFILSVLYNYFLRDNKVAETITGAEGIGMGIKSIL